MTYLMNDPVLAVQVLETAKPGTVLLTHSRRGNRSITKLGRDRYLVRFPNHGKPIKAEVHDSELALELAGGV